MFIRVNQTRELEVVETNKTNKYTQAHIRSKVNLTITNKLKGTQQTFSALKTSIETKKRREFHKNVFTCREAANRERRAGAIQTSTREPRIEPGFKWNVTDVRESLQNEWRGKRNTLSLHLSTVNRAAKETSKKSQLSFQTRKFLVLLHQQKTNTKASSKLFFLVRNFNTPKILTLLCVRIFF